MRASRGRPVNGKSACRLTVARNSATRRRDAGLLRRSSARAACLKSARACRLMRGLLIAGSPLVSHFAIDVRLEFGEELVRHFIRFASIRLFYTDHDLAPQVGQFLL